jgi:2-keto-3-deoxy-L-rhamnonate aldolase RhmA
MVATGLACALVPHGPAGLRAAARSSGHLNSSRFLDGVLKLHMQVLHMGLEHVEAIAAVEGIDMIAYGHSDPGAQLGVHLQLEHPTFKAAVRPPDRESLWGAWEAGPGVCGIGTRF